MFFLNYLLLRTLINNILNFLILVIRLRRLGTVKTLACLRLRGKCRKQGFVTAV